jgi:hypothetical protein
MGERLEDLKDPQFLEYLKTHVGLPISPDHRGYNFSVVADTVEVQAHPYRLAEARKMLRLYREWKAGLK